jgi:hypothetical protein
MDFAKHLLTMKVRLLFLQLKGFVKAIPVTVNRFTDGGKVVSLRRRPLFTPRNIPGAHFC